MGCFISSAESDNSIVDQASKKLKIVIIGLESAGKTTILQYLKSGQFVQTSPTVGLNVENIQYKSRNYLIFDVGGKVRTLWSHYYESLDGLIFVIDSCDKQKLQQVGEELAIVNKDLEGQNLFILLFLNKCDQPDALDTETLIKEISVQVKVEQDVVLQRCSGKSGEGIWDGIEKLNNLLTSKFKGSLKQQK